jgi:hypothetical protein
MLNIIPLGWNGRFSFCSEQDDAHRQKEYLFRRPDKATGQLYLSAKDTT